MCHVYNIDMKQYNINMTVEFERMLTRYMKAKRLANKAEAIRLAVKEALSNEKRQHRRADFRSLLGIGLKAPLRKDALSLKEDDLW